MIRRIRMEYFISQNNQPTGPYPEETIRQMLATGAAKPTDLGWHQGLPTWQPIASIIPNLTGFCPPPVVVEEQKTPALGKISFTIGILGIPVWLGFLVAAGFGAASGHSESSPYMIILGLCMMLFLLFNGLGLVLGLVAAFQKNSRKILSVIGSCLNGCQILGMGAIILLGLVMKDKAPRTAAAAPPTPILDNEAIPKVKLAPEAETDLQVVTDGAPDRDAFAATIQNLLIAENFEALDSMANELRQTKARFPEGIWKLQSFYEGLEEPPEQVKFEEWLLRLDRWKEKFPESISARVAKGHALTKYAWKARGGGWSKEVTDEGWKLFRERLAEARKVLEEAQTLPTPCPSLPNALQTVALGQGWSRAEYDKLFNEAVAREPSYSQYYLSKSHYLLPRWHGEEGDWEQFARETAEKVGGSEGIQLYTRIVWSKRWAYKGTLFSEADVDWAKMKQGFEELDKQYPNSIWNLNAFCYFACQAQDKETARTLFQRLGGKVCPEIWGTKTEFAKARIWAIDS
jgi:hypothetical protein